MKFQRLLLAIALFSASVSQATITPAQRVDLQQFSAAPEQAQTNMRLSSENENLFSSIAKALNYSPMQVKKASPELIASAQRYATQAYSPEVDTLFVNEEWLNSMPIEERTYKIAKSLWTIREMGLAYARASFNKNGAKKLANIEREADERIVKTLHCLGGALAVLRKDRSSLEQSCNKDALSNDKTYTSLNSRIAHLEILKLAQNV